MSDSNYRTLLEEMQDMNIKWLSVIFSWRNILKKKNRSSGHLLRNTPIKYQLIQAHAQQINAEKT
jgi:hypothetical protein